ncbi:cytochrome P450 [Xylariaceae sp. FL0255]|nr:cytochrome P450 [Xylariaceae sp. FL0255]
MILFDTPNIAFAVVPCLFFAWTLFTTIYSWQRLRHASWSYLWIAKFCWKGKQYEDYLDLANKYGPLVRVGPNELVCDSPDVARHIARTKTNRSDWYLGFRFNPYHSSMFNILEAGPHDKRKAQLTPGYSGKDANKSGGIEAVVDYQLSNLVEQIRTKYARPRGGFCPMDLAAIIPLFTLDVISHLVLGTEFGLHGFYRSLQNHLPSMSLSTEIPFFRKIFYSSIGLKLFGPKETDKEGLGRLMKLVNAKVWERYNEPNAKTEGDILGSFVRNGLTQTECEVETLFLFIAGSETTANALKATMLYLLTNPVAYLRLRDECHTAVREGRVSNPIKFAEAKTLPYLQAVTYEGLRIRPVTTFRLPKDIPSEGDTLNGYFVPGGTSVGVNISSLLRSRTVFGDDANVFRPERFIEADEATRTEMQRNVELNFGYGRWMCSGKPIAWMELHKTCFELIRHFDFQLVDPTGIAPSLTFGNFLDRNWFVRVTESIS